MAITNEEEFEKWLQAQSQEVCVAIAYRATMRVLPVVTSIDFDSRRNSHHALVALRACLSGVSHMVTLNYLTEAAAKTAAVAARQAGDASAESILDVKDFRALQDVRVVGTATAARPFVTNVLHAVASFATATTAQRNSAAAASIAETATALYHASYATPDTIFHEGQEPGTDALAVFLLAHLDSELPLERLQNGSIPVPEKLAKIINNWGGHRMDLLRSGGPWTFWAKWYGRAMAGDPLPWDLQEQIALIPNEVWDAGPEAVAEEIARIEARYAVRQKIEEIEEAASSVSDGRFGVGGNNPPEPIEPAPQDAQRILLIWDAVEAVKEETEADEPNRERLEWALGLLQGGALVVAKYLGAKADLAIKTVIVAGITTGCGYLAANPGQLQQLIQLVQDWMKVL